MECCVLLVLHATPPHRLPPCWLLTWSGGRRFEQVAFEVRVEPGSYKCGPPSEPVKKPFRKDIEWYTDHTWAVFLSGLLVRVKPVEKV